MTFEQINRLKFPNQIAGLINDITVSPESSDAATIKITEGEPNASINIQVVENTIDLQSSTSSTVTVSSFTVLGPYPSVFDPSGEAVIKIGGAVHIGLDNTYGSYYGQATLRVTYN